jgi:hypothetical protein
LASRSHPRDEHYRGFLYNQKVRHCRHLKPRPADTADPDPRSAAARRRAKAVNDSYVANMRDTMRAAIRDADNAEEDMPFRPTEAEQATTHCSSPERRRLQAQGSSSQDAYDLSPTK